MKCALPLVAMIIMICRLSADEEDDLYHKGVEAYNKRDFLTAITYMNQVIAMDPDGPNAYIARGDSYTLSGNPDKGIEDATKAISLNPDKDALVQAYVDRSSAYADKKLWSKVIDDCLAAIKEDANAEPAYSNLVGGYLMTGELDKGLDTAKTALTLNPGDAITLKFQVGIFEKKGDFASAKAAQFKVAELESGRPVDINGIAWFLATCPDAAGRDGKKAVELATKFCLQTNWSTAGYIDTLATAYAETGDFAHAVKYEEQALAGSLSEAVKKDAQARLTLFQANQPYHEKP